jgi:uncharacterized protein (DUF1800 family)
MNRAQVLKLAVAAQAVVLGAACSYDRARPHPLRSRRVQMAHLLRRAGFGAGKDQLDEYESLGLARAVDRLLDFEPEPDDVEERLKVFGLNLNRLADLQRWWLLRMVYSPRQLHEKMVLFWHGLLTTGSSKVGLPNPTPQNPDPPHYLLTQHQFFRAHALDTFENVLQGISRDPGMMVWLDAQTNNKGKPNENYARELMELFALGIGHYTEQDVREAARAFTGSGLERGRFAFRPANHDTGQKTILGKTGNFDGRAVVTLLAAQPQAARHLSGKLFEFFAYPDPAEEDLEPLVATYVRTGGSVREMLRTLFTSPAFYSPRAYRAKIKSPVELTVGAVRALGVSTDASTLPGVTTRMGQALFNPPNVGGWPGGAHWLNTTAWLERLNFSNTLVTARNDGRAPAPRFENILARNKLETPDAVIDYFGDLLLDGQVSQAMRATLMGYLTNGQLATVPLLTANRAARDALRVQTTRPAFVDQKVRGLVYLMLASPEYQLA